LAAIASWAAELGLKGLQIPTWDLYHERIRMFHVKDAELIRLAAKVSMAVTSPGSTVLAASARSVTDKWILRQSSRDSRSTTTPVGLYLRGSVVSNGQKMVPAKGSSSSPII